MLCQLISQLNDQKSFLGGVGVGWEATSKACSCSCCTLLQQNDLEACQAWETICSQTNETILTLFSSTWELELINLQVQCIVFLLYFRTILISQSCRTKHASTICSWFSKIYFLYLLHLKASQSIWKKKKKKSLNMEMMVMSNISQWHWMNQAGEGGWFTQEMLEVSSD